MVDTFRASRVALLAGHTTCRQIAHEYLERIAAANPALNAFVHVDADRTLAIADSVDRRMAAGEQLPLAGCMLAVKDVICEKEVPVQAASGILEGFSSLFDATVIERLVAAGAVPVGRTNCDEFAMGSSNEHSVYGRAKHPTDPSLVPGGSSGGSAAAVATGLCHVALGSDTGGSIRQPAAFCGVSGLKPTYGRVSRYGLVAYASSFDSIGPMARDLDALAATLQVMAGHDVRDSTSAEVPVPDLDVSGGVAGLRVGLPREYFGDGLDPDVERSVREAVARLEAGGATIVDISLPHTEFGIATYYVLTTAEASSNLARYDGVRYGARKDVREAHAKQRARAAGAAGPDTAAEEMSLLEQQYVATRTSGFGHEVKLRIMLGTYVLSAGYYDAYYGKAQRVRTLVRRDFERAFEDVDLIVSPATPGPAFEAGSRSDDPVSMYLSDVYTVTANLAGIPGLVVPGAPTPSGLPVGVQLLASHFREDVLLRAGDVAKH